MDGNSIAIKKLKGYSCAQDPAFVKAYGNFLSMPHFPKVGTMFGLSPNSGCMRQNLPSAKVIVNLVLS